MQQKRTWSASTLIATLLLSATGLGTTAGQESKSDWVDVSSTLVQTLESAGQKTDWPGGTAGVAVDSSNGDVYVIVAGLGIYKSSDVGHSFTRVDGGKVGGRCETSYSINVDSSGKRLACFMLDGKGAWSGDQGKSWNSFADVGRNWDYAAVDWSAEDPKTIFAALHESGGKVMTSSDGGQNWKLLFEDAEFDKSGGLGVFDAKTLVYAQKGKGIQRSTDLGRTWVKVSDHEPIGRLMIVHDGKGYWLSRQGLLVSNDKGTTWELQGRAVDASIGPYIDPKNEKRIVVAGAKGIYLSADGGENWEFVGKLPTGFEKLPKDGWYTNVAWDPVHDVFYASLMGKATYRLEGAY